MTASAPNKEITRINSCENKNNNESIKINVLINKNKQTSKQTNINTDNERIIIFN